MRLSIIIPHYNSADTINRALDSIPANPQIQVILVDDGSDPKQWDRLSQAVQEQKKRLPALVLCKNQGEKGAGMARNRGIREACGEWLLFLDADDHLLPDAWKKLEPWLDTEADLVFFAPVSRREDGRPGKRHVLYERLVRDYLEEKAGPAALRLRYQYVSPCSKLVRRELVARNNICYDNTQVANDVMFAVKCGYFAGRIAAADTVIYCITEGTGTLTTAATPESMDVRIRVFMEMYRFLQERLPAEEFDMLGLCGFGYLSKLRHMGSSAGKLLEVARLFQKNRIPIVTRQLLRELRRKG